MKSIIKFLQKFILVLLALGLIQFIFIVWGPQKPNELFMKIFVTEFAFGVATLIFLVINWITGNKK
ncbi:hypothetical protein KAZ01_02365 [Candidatus Gracilibacteria bacterium]|nr:hypothetical protein [Candidatus Gracilibacteria bacterium]